MTPPHGFNQYWFFDAESFVLVSDAWLVDDESAERYGQSIADSNGKAIGCMREICTVEPNNNKEPNK